MVITRKCLSQNVTCSSQNMILMHKMLLLREHRDFDAPHLFFTVKTQNILCIHHHIVGFSLFSLSAVDMKVTELLTPVNDILPYIRVIAIAIWGASRQTYKSETYKSQTYKTWYVKDKDLGLDHCWRGGRVAR